ncbi:MAG: ATP-binding protein [Gemmatimonadota bacterium]|nr:ATP-binding protein [Gemmatimonadota bacterium]
MSGKRIIFGVRARLVLLITLLLAGVSSTQYVINYRQQQAVISQLLALNHQINDTLRDIDRRVRERSLPRARRSFPAGMQNHITPGPSGLMEQELRSFLEYVDSNLGRLLAPDSDPADITGRIARLRELSAMQERAPEAAGSSFFQVTVSVMDEISRRSSLWGYTVSSSATMPPSDNILQVSIPIVEEGRVHFVHIRYQISDFLERFERYRLFSLAVTLSVLGLGIVAALFLSGYFTSPIRRLSDGFSRIEQGDLDCRIDTGRSDEMGQLVAGFNHMVAQLRQNKEMQKNLYREERLSSLGKLAAGIAHEIKNPLNAINLSLQHLDDKLGFSSRDDKELFDRYSRNIQGEVGRLSRIVDTFLNFSRVSELERSETALHELIEDVLTLLHRDTRDRGVRVEREYAQGKLVKRVDPEKMKTVFFNLVINAVESMPSGGKLRIATSGGGEAPARIVVSDTGCGIPAENLERIFDLYYSTREQGSGLGLAIVNDIVRDHGGEITVSSSLGTGTDFTVIIL